MPLEENRHFGFSVHKQCRKPVETDNFCRVVYISAAYRLQRRSIRHVRAEVHGNALLRVVEKRSVARHPSSGQGEKDKRAERCHRYSFFQYPAAGATTRKPVQLRAQNAPYPRWFALRAEVSP